MNWKPETYLRTLLELIDVEELWMAMDSDGDWEVYRDKPISDEEAYWSGQEHWEFLKAGVPIIPAPDWKKSLVHVRREDG